MKAFGRLTRLLGGTKADMTGPFLEAAEKGDKLAVYDFYKRGWNLDARDEDGCTALICAARGGHKEVVLYLCLWSADVNACDNDGRSALHYSTRFGLTEIVNILIYFQANVNCQDREELTALHVAASLGHSDIVKLLFYAGASLMLKDKRGRTAEDLAFRMGNFELQNLRRQEAERKDFRRSTTSPLPDLDAETFKMSHGDVEHHYISVHDVEYESTCDRTNYGKIDEEGTKIFLFYYPHFTYQSSSPPFWLFLF